jgi:hypothetical protein
LRTIRNRSFLGSGARIGHRSRLVVPHATAIGRPVQNVAFERSCCFAERPPPDRSSL